MEKRDEDKKGILGKDECKALLKGILLGLEKECSNEIIDEYFEKFK